MNQVKAFAKVLSYRNVFKSIQQLSWEVSQLERQFDIEGMGKDEMEDMADVYGEYVPRLEKILDELKELQDDTKRMDKTS